MFNWCYHGTVDETLSSPSAPTAAASREGNVGPPVDPAATSRVAEFNDLEALERELAHGDVACVLMEPALTNIGIVLPEPGYLEGVRELTRRHGSAAGHRRDPHPVGRARRLHPGLGPGARHRHPGQGDRRRHPAGAYGLSAEVAERLAGRPDLDLVDTGGVGGTLAGNALSLAAMRATLEQVLTDDAFEHMIGLATRFTAGVQRVIDACQMPWSVVQLGARSEYRFTSPAPGNGGQSAAAGDDELDDYLHLYLAQPGHPADPVPQHGPDVPGHHRAPTSTGTPRCSGPPWPSWPATAAEGYQRV